MPLILDVEPPQELFALPPWKVVGLTIELDALIEIRQARLRAMGMPVSTNYALRDHVRQELAFAERIFHQHPDWVVLDVTRKAVEETASEILRLRRAALRSSRA
jgi:regulator of PEP synthase PpsR (kinase-PPPase family)